MSVAYATEGPLSVISQFAQMNDRLEGELVYLTNRVSDVLVERAEVDCIPAEPCETTLDSTLARYEALVIRLARIAASIKL